MGPLTIYGPRGIQEYVRTSLRVSQTHLGYPLKFVEFAPNEAGVAVDDERFRVEYAPLDHRIPCVVTGWLKRTIRENFRLTA